MRVGHCRSYAIYIGGTMELGEGAEGWVLPGVHTPFSHKQADEIRKRVRVNTNPAVFNT